MKSRAGIYRAQNICRYAAVKGSTQQRSVSTQRRRALRCCIPESGKRVTQRHRVLRCCVPESQPAKNFMFATQQRRVIRCCVPEGMEQGFSIFFKTQIWPSHTLMNM